MVNLDLLVTLEVLEKRVTKEVKVGMVSMESKEKEEKKEYLAKEVQMVQEDLEVELVTEEVWESEVQREKQDSLDLLALWENRAHLDLKVQEVLEERLVYLAFLARMEFLDHLEREAHPENLDLKDCRDPLVFPDHLDLWVNLVLLENLEFLDHLVYLEILVGLEILERRDLLDHLVHRESLEELDHQDCLDSQEIEDYLDCLVCQA